MNNVEKLYHFDPFSGKTGIPLEDIQYFYVPFDQLMNHSQIETILLTEFKKQAIGKFYGLLGKSGSGKSSVLNYLLSELSSAGSKTFCIKINEFYDNITGTRDLLRHIIRKIHRMSSQFIKLGETEKNQARKMLAKEYVYTSEERQTAKTGLKTWFNVIPMVLGMSIDASTELESQSGVEITEDTTLEELIVFTNQLVESLQKNAGITHVVVMLDETDKIRKPGTTEISSDEAKTFFLDAISKLEKTKCSYVFVLNNQYNTASFKSSILEPYFTKTLEIPSITTQKAMTMIIEKRTKAACGQVKLNDVWDESCMDHLYSFYEKESLRQLMPVCRNSIEKARSDDAETISVRHVKHAIMEEDQ